MTSSSSIERVALVTGGSRGIGQATSLRLAREGRAVAVNYRENADAAAGVVEQIRVAGGKAIAVRADVTDRAAVSSMVEEVGRSLGPIGVLVNNAGLLHSGDLLSYDEEQFDQMWQVNVKAVLNVTAAVAPSMIESRYGRIVNLSSIAAAGTAFKGTSLYAATKAAVLILTKRFALELGPRGITVNAVLPGFTLTDMVTAGKTPQEVEETIAAVSRKSMLRRGGQPEDIAAVISFLASDDAGFVTGQYLTADGGRMDYLTHA